MATKSDTKEDHRGTYAFMVIGGAAGLIIPPTLAHLNIIKSDLAISCMCIAFLMFAGGIYGAVTQ